MKSGAKTDVVVAGKDLRRSYIEFHKKEKKGRKGFYFEAKQGHISVKSWALPPHPNHPESFGNEKKHVPKCTKSVNCTAE